MFLPPFRDIDRVFGSRRGDGQSDSYARPSIFSNQHSGFIIILYHAVVLQRFCQDAFETMLRKDKHGPNLTNPAVISVLAAL